ncbi:MAG: translin family protein [Euryarchaeota archaeon]|nr:translin family protein [Euryarchaeota archaeon]MDE1837234.1 translin family protein [Euryarchaeota archaeon]MDE1879845.1 translin family protein [Euryarchaeota archaeon]MDE2045162.1 translin family protein [Thermoplasmata archaeon]
MEERDRLFEEARVVRRAAQDAMRRFHAGEDPGATLRALAPRVRRLQHLGEGGEGIVGDALQEYAEARFLEAVVGKRPLPSLTALEVPVEAYLGAMGDVVGEVRRLAVAALGEELLSEAEGYLDLMDAMLHALLRFEAPRGIIALKPKQDVARSLVERTRAEVALARVLRRAARAVGAEGDRMVAEGLKAAGRLG